MGSLSSAPPPALMALASSNRTPAPSAAVKGTPRVTAGSVLAISVPRGGRAGAESSPAAADAPASAAAVAVAEDAGSAAEDAGASAAAAAPTSPTRAFRAAMRAVEHIIELAVRESEVERLVREADRADAESPVEPEMTDEEWQALVK